MELTIKPIINPLYRFQWEKVQDCYVFLFPEGMVKLSASAGEIVLLVDGLKSIADIISELQQRFPDAEGIDNDVIEFIKDAYEKNWLQDN